jgi:transposase
VRQIRAETGEPHGTVQRVAAQLGYGVEAVRKSVNPADVDAGDRPGVTTEDNPRIPRLEQEVRELVRANEILKSALSVFPADGDDQGAASTPSSWPPWAGSTGSTPNGATATSTTSRLPSSKPRSKPNTPTRPWLEFNDPSLY